MQDAFPKKLPQSPPPTLTYKVCEHCQDSIQGLYCLMTSLEDTDYGRQFFVCHRCLRGRYIIEGKVAEC